METKHDVPSRSFAEGAKIIALSPAQDEESLESAACGIQCDCNAKW